MEHPITELELERFAAGSATREERRFIVAHLLRGCPPCAARLRALALPRTVVEGAYDKVFSRLEGFLPDEVDPEDPLKLTFLHSLPRPAFQGPRGPVARRH